MGKESVDVAMTESSSPPDQRQRVAKACDACKLRKVKCNGQQRCQQCEHLDLRCIYSTHNSRPRTQGRRGHVILKFKESTAGDATPSSRTLSPTLSPDEIRLDAAFFYDLIPDFLEHVYPVQPIMNEEEIREKISTMTTDHEARAFVYAFGGCTLNLTRTGRRRTDDVVRKINHLVQEAIKARGLVMPNLHSSVPQCMTSLFLHNCLMTSRDCDTAFFYMRDAITLIQLLRIDNMDETLLPPERARRQRLYWEAYIHERFLAILDYRQAILPPLQNLPEDDPTIPIAIQEGFNQIIKLFKLFDAEFLQNWLGRQTNGPSITPDWIEQKDKELAVGEDGDLPQGFEVLTPMQRADLIVTRHWMRTLVWRLAMTNTLLSSGSSKECLSLLFPLRLSNQLGYQVTRIDKEDIEIHGSGIVQKLFEIADTIADVVLHIPAHDLKETQRRVADFEFWLNFVFTFSILDQARRNILNDKHKRIQEMFETVSAYSGSPSTLVATPSTPGDPWSQITRSMMQPAGAGSPEVNNLV